MADNYNDIKLSNSEVFLENFSPILKKVLDNNADARFSRFELILPVILDNYQILDSSIVYVQQNDLKSKAFSELKSWLRDNGYLNNDMTLVNKNKEITIQDMIRFAVKYCNEIRVLTSTAKGEVSEASSLYGAINPAFFKDERVLPDVFNKNNEPVSMSYDSLFKSLETQNSVYSSTVDKILRLLSTERKFNVDDTETVNKNQSLGRVVFSGITKTWNEIIQKDKIIDILNQSNVKQDINNYIKNHSPEQNFFNLRPLYQINSDAKEFYECLEYVYNNNFGNLKSNKQIEDVVKYCDPAGFLFLLQKVEDKATESYTPTVLPGSNSKYVTDLKNLRDVLRKLKPVIDLFKSSNRKELDMIYNPEKNVYEFPKTLNPIDTKAFYNLLVNISPDKLRDKNFDILTELKSRVDSITDLNTLRSLSNSFSNEYVVKAITENIAQTLTKKALVSDPYNLKIKDVDNSNGKSIVYEVNFGPDNNVLKKLKSEVNDLIDQYISYLRIYNKVLSMIRSGRFNLDSGIYEKASESETQLLKRSYLFTFADKLKALNSYSKNKNIDSLNYYDIIEDKMTLDHFILNVNLLMLSLRLPLDFDSDVLDIKLTMDKLPTEEEIDSIYASNEKEAQGYVHELEIYIDNKLQHEVNTGEPAENVPIEMTDINSIFGNFLDRLHFERFAAGSFTEADLVEFFNDLYKNYSTDDFVSKRRQTLLTNVHEIDEAADNLIYFLNLRKQSDINASALFSYISQLNNITSNPDYVNLISDNINLDFINENKTSVVLAVKAKLNSQHSQLNYDDILNNILSLNKDIFKSSILSTISKKDPQIVDAVNQIRKSKISSLDSTVLASIPPSIQQAVVVVAANVLYDTYVKSIPNHHTGLINFLSNQKFNLMLDICNKLEGNNGFTQLLFNSVDKFHNIDYHLNAKNEFYNLSKKSSYKGTPDKIIQMIANYKVLSRARGILFNAVITNNLTNNIMNGCSDWDFSDDLINGVLKHSQIYDLKSNLVAGNVSTLQANIALPFNNKYVENDFNAGDTDEGRVERAVRKISSKLKGLNAVSVNRNIMALYKLIKLNEDDILGLIYDAEVQLKGLNKLLESIKEKGNEAVTDNEKYRSKNRLLKFLQKQNLSVQQVGALKINLNNHISDFKDNINYIITAANGVIETLRPELFKKITNWYTDHPELKEIVKITTKFDRHNLGLFTRKFNILPIDYEISPTALNKFTKNKVEKEILSIEEKLRSMDQTVKQFVYNAIVQDLNVDLLTGLEIIQNRIENLITQLHEKAEQNLGHKCITISYINDEVDKLKSDLINSLVGMSEKTNECFSKTLALEKDLNQIEMISSTIQIPPYFLN